MKKNIIKYFYLYLIFFLLFGLIFLIVSEIFLNKKIKNEVKYIQNYVIKTKKEQIKKDVLNIKNVFNFIKKTIYTINNEEILFYVNIPIKLNLKKLYIENNYIYGLINKRLKYFIKDNNIFVKLRNNDYLVALKNKGKDVYIFGVNRKLLDNFIIYNFLNYLNIYNKHKISYIAIVKVFRQLKNGKFGYIYYMPANLKNFEGKILSLNETDNEGNYYRKKYFTCYKKDRPCFIKYFFENPKTKKIEEKISYFDFIKNYDFIFLKGFYASQIRNEIHKKLSLKITEIKNLINRLLVIFFIIYVIFLTLSFILLSSIKKSLLQEYEKLKKELFKKAYIDYLTDLPNRNKLIIDILIKHAKALVLIDITNFTQINDVYGFSVGDEILKLTARKLKEKYKNVYRVGSDEFVILFEKKIDENILEAISRIEIKTNNFYTDFIIGASNYKERLLESSELALKEACMNKKKYILFDENMLKKQKERIEKILMLREILKKENIIPYYQCIVDKEENIMKYEALMRLNVNNEIKSPYFFMDLLKEAKLYIPFSKIMIKKVFEDLEKINKKVSINLSFEDIANDDMRKFILDLINENNAKKVVFEILESESIQNYNLIKEFINQVKLKGAEIAIDDFGSGYSNFYNIMKLNPNIIKIDASLIKEMGNEKNFKLIELITTYAKYFNLKVVAEYVSDREKFVKLKKIGVDEFQGYYFCTPQPLENIIKKDKISSKKGNDEN